jgi:hypothetical protein
MSDAVPATGGDALLDTLQTLHPPRLNSEHEIYTNPIPEDVRANIAHIDVPPQLVHKMIYQSTKYTAPGPDGFRNEHKRQLAGDYKKPAEVNYVNNYAEILSLILNGQLPIEVSNYFAGAELIALQVGEKVRPIALGNTLRKDAGKFGIKTPEVIKVCNEIFFPIQVGVGIKNGTENGINPIRISMEKDPTKHVFKTDNRNAYNSMDRVIILQEALKICPNAFPLISTMLKTESNLWNLSKDNNNNKRLSVIKSSSGSQQGDVFGGLCYCIGLQPFLIQLSNLLATMEDTEDSFAILKAYIDDGILTLNTAQLLKILECFIDVGPTYGVHLRKDKVSILLGRFQYDIEANDLRLLLIDSDGLGLNVDKVHLHPDNGGDIHSYGIILLGSPLGSQEFIKGFLTKMISGLQPEKERLKTYRPIQAKFRLFTACFSKKVDHILRTVDPALTIEYLITPFNLMLREIAETISCCPFDERAWSQCLLPLNQGGWGIGINPMQAHAAYAASILSTLPSIRKVLPNLDDLLQQNDRSLPSISAFIIAISTINYKNYNAYEALILAENPQGRTDKIQATLLTEFREAAFARHLNSLQGSPSLVAALISVASQDASSWLTSNFDKPSMQMNDAEFTTATRLYFRMDLQLPSNLSCVCKQRSPVDLKGDHFLVCKKGREKFDNHNTVVDVIAAMCRHAGLRVDVEAPGLLSEVDDAKKLRPDIRITGLDRPILGDVGISFPISSGLTLNQARIPGRVTSDYAKVKHTKYDEYARRINNDFIPFIFETRGRWHHEFHTFFTTVLNHSSLISNIPLKALKIYWRRRISIALQRVVARSIHSKTKKINSPTFSDESNYDGVILDEAGIDMDYISQEMEFIDLAASSE